MENSTRYFANTSCEYYPCHKSPETEKGFNCLFCYCPMYSLNKCPGHPKVIRTKEGKQLKDCSECNFPHKPENYDLIMGYLLERG